MKNNVSEWYPEEYEGLGYPPSPKIYEARIVVIGNFDGAHLGHGAIITEAKAIASRLTNKIEVVVLTFDPHPRRFFLPDAPSFQLCSEINKAKKLGDIGADAVVALPFTKKLASLSPYEFVELVLVNKLGISGVVVGSNFRFGKGREGTPQLLQELGKHFGFIVSIVSPKKLADETIISSSAIREALSEGDIERAKAMLGYDFSITGIVEHGAKRGRNLGFPTANIEISREIKLAHGVYAVRVMLEDKLYEAVANFGRRPHFDNGRVLLEVHIFDFSGDIYGKKIEIFFIKRLRGEEKFADISALIEQMGRDCENAKEVLLNDGGNIL